MVSIRGTIFTDRHHARPAEFWLLRTAWRRHGLLDPDAIPGPAG